MIRYLLGAFMHHAVRFCLPGWRPHAVDPEKDRERVEVSSTDHNVANPYLRQEVV
jgi:hypothetical protein